MRRKAVSPETSKVRPKKRRQLTSEIRHWFAAEIAVWPHDPQLPLTWENLVAKGAALHRWTWSRSGLSRCPEIAAAFGKRSGELAAGRDRTPKNPARADEVRTRARLLAQIAQLKAENEKLLRQFRTWQKNAHARNITVDDLNEPWDEVDRGQTDLGLRAKKGLSLPQHVPSRPKKR
ncbi:hypothetical protein [Methylobacterium haplocladii]|nr:hypothetical protein [Methylobacterium haplocladii]